MKGFFNKNDFVGQTDNCQKCGLYKKCQSPRMEYTGIGEKRILIIAEAPGKTEDKQNKQLVGQAGDLLRNALAGLGLNLDKDFWKINSVNCRPSTKEGDNRKPTSAEIKFCRPRVIEVIKKLNPKFIWLMGGVSIESFYGDDFSDDLSITRWRKRCIPDYDFNTWIVPLYHPSYILRKKDEKLSKTFNKDLEWAVSLFGKEFPEKPDFEKYVHPIYDEFIIKDVLSKLKGQQYVSFDYETSSLNPYKGTPKIFFASVASEDYAYAFEITDAIVSNCIEFLTDRTIHKIAHNLKFEDKWSRVVFDVQPESWYWDTMVSQHVLDGRKKTTGLKFQAYVRYGLKNYDQEIDKYKKNWYAVLNNPVLLNKSLLYCGMDSLITLKLFHDQFEEFKNRPLLQSGNQLFFDGNLALGDVERNGIPIDIQHYSDQDKILGDEINDLSTQLMSSDESKLFKKTYHKDIDLASPTDLKSLFYVIKNIKATKQTDKGNDSIDQSVLVDINTEFTNNLLELRKLEKTKGTYLAQFLRETCDDGKLRPSFNLNMVTTFRSSSDKPNFQNIPVRDEKAKFITRSGIIPTKGNKILEVDYSAMEARIIACLSHDQVLIDYIKAGKDIHAEEAMSLFRFSDVEWHSLSPKNAKDIRFYTKNQKVFPYFYGSWYESCAKNMWPLIDKLGIKDHLRKKGLGTYEKFEVHCQRDENRFWNRFAGVREWQKQTEKFYLENGFVNYVTGFQSEGYLTRNDLYNWIVQGPAFHCLLWSLIQLNRELKDKETKIIGQIHDSIVLDLYPPEEEMVFNLCKGIMTRRIRKVWPWLIVPLEVSFEMTEIDGTWYSKKEVSNGTKA